MITAPEIHTDIFWNLSILFVGLTILYFLAIFYYRNKFKIKKADAVKRRKILAPMVSEFLFYQENEGTKDEKNNYINQKIEIRELIKDKKNETVLSEILLDLKKDVSGETRKRLFSLYKDLNLEQEAFKKLKSFKWQNISQGMFELTQMQVVESYSFINGFINNKRSVVRKQAEISTVTLMHEGISYFLDTTKYPISEWQQLKILEVLTNLTDFQPPRFSKWLTSKNKYVVLFALRLISHFDQNDAEESIISLVRHKNNHIKREAVNCIKKFNFESSRIILKAVFWRNNSNIKLILLDALADFENMEDIPFLESVDKKESNFTVRSKALSAINTIHPEYVIPSIDIEEIEANLPEAIGNDAITVEEIIIEAENIIVPIETIDKIQEEILETIFNIRTTEKTSDTTILEVLTHEANPVEVDPVAVIDDNISMFSENDEFPIENETSTADAENFHKEDNNPFNDSIDSSEDPNIELSASYQSIFKSLFDSSDEYCKLLLLDEILEIGNIKEISFLASLHDHHNLEIKSKALLIKNKLQHKLDAAILRKTTNVEALQHIENDIAIESFDDTQEIVNANPLNEDGDENITDYKNTNGLMPLEFCFLLGELEIKLAKEFDFFDIKFDIELSSEEFPNISEEEDRLTKEERTFFQKLLEFPSTLNDIF